jgi:hypothetical protein
MPSGKWEDYLDENQQFLDVLTSLKRDDLIDLIDVTVDSPGGPEFINSSDDLDISDIDNLGEQVVRIQEFRSGKTVRKGLRFNQASIWQRVKREMHLLLCTTDKKYAALRKQISKEGSSTHTAIVSAIAAAVGAQLGVISGLLVPLVALILVGILKVGKEAYCAELA